MSTLLTSKLSAVRRKRAMVTALTGIASAVGAVALLFGITAVVDWWLELSFYARAAMLAIELALLAYVLIWHVARPIVYGPDDEELALSVEAQTPDFRSRLISCIQLLQPEAVTGGTSPALVGALLRETEEMAEPMDFTRVIKIDRLATLGTISALILVGFGLAVALTAPQSIALVQRGLLMNVPVPRKTQVEVLSRDLIVPRGESVSLLAKASGLVIPENGSVELTFKSGSKQTFSMDREEGAADQYARAIDNVQEDFTYVVLLNDGHSEPFTVTAAVRPAVAGIDVQQQFPAYTQGGTVKRKTGDLTILEGSRLLLNVTANKPLKVTGENDKIRNYIHLHGVDEKYPLTPNVNNTAQAAVRDGILPPKGTTGFSVHLVDENGLTSKNPAIYPITLIADQPPKVTITFPRRNDELVTSAATVDLGFEASDDYGVAEVYLRYRQVDPDGSAPQTEGDGLKGEYFNRNNGVDEKAAEQIDGQISFDWGAKNRPPAELRPPFAVRWSGQLQPTTGGEFTFHIEGKNVVTVTLDGKPILRSGENGGSSLPINLKAFQRYDLKVEYASHKQATAVRMLWEGPGIAKQIVPRANLYTVPIADKTSTIASQGVPEKVIQLQVPTNKVARGYYPWKIAEVARSMPIGSVIQWRLEVRDNNNVSGPGVTMSDPRQLRLVSETDKRKELMDRMSDTLTQIDSISDSQRDLRDKTAQIVTGKPIDRPIDLPPKQD